MSRDITTVGRWAGEDSNLRRLCRRFYRPLPLAARAPAPTGDDSNRYPAPMAQSSFDIVSEVALQEVRNAVDQASIELHQRLDLKNTDTALTLPDDKIEMHSATQERIKATYQ